MLEKDGTRVHLLSKFRVSASVFTSDNVQSHRVTSSNRHFVESKVGKRKIGRADGLRGF